MVIYLQLVIQIHLRIEMIQIEMKTLVIQNKVLLQVVHLEVYQKRNVI